MMDYMDAVKARRSCRGFLKKPIPDNAIADMLLAAQLAPSGGNGQSHLFGIVDDEATKLALAKAAGSQMWIADAPVVIACCAYLGEDLKTLPEDDFGRMVDELRFSRPFIEYMNQYEDRKAAQTLFANGVPLIPAEHMVLAAVSHGLDACFIGYLDVREAGKILNLPDNAVCLFLLPVGYAKDAPGEKSLKSIEEITFRNRFSIRR